MTTISGGRTALVLFAAAALLLSVLTLPASEARADEPTRPNWSGLDVADYSGPIPAAAGALMAQVTLDPSLSLPAAGDAYRIQFSSRNQHGTMATSTGAVFLPKGTAPAGGWPVISWAHGTVGMDDACTPSAFPRSDRDSDYLGHWLQQGYAVVAADYTGLGSPGLMAYLDGKTAAHSIVDSVVAAQQLALPAGAKLAKRWAIVGQSQGASAALNGARYATEFSRGSGLHYRGVVATGVPANLEQLYQHAGPAFPPVSLPGSLNAYTAYILAGFDEARPDLRLGSVLTARGKQRLAQARGACVASLETMVADDDVRTWFRAPLNSIPGASAALSEYMGTPYRGYDRPVFLGQGLLDADVPAPSALSLYAQMKAHDQPVTLHVYPDEDHSGALLASMADSTPWLARVLR